MFSSVSQTKLPPQDNRTLGSSATKAKSSSAFHWLRGREISYRPPSSEQCKTTLMTRNIKANSFSRKEQTCEDPLSLDLELDAQGDLGVTANSFGNLNVHLWDLRTHKIRWIFDTVDHLPDDDDLDQNFEARNIKIVPRNDDVEKGYVFYVLDSKNSSDNIEQILFKINIKSGELENVCYLGLVRVTKIMVVGEKIFGLSGSSEPQAHYAKSQLYEIDDNGRPFPLSNPLLFRIDSRFAASEEFLVSTVNLLEGSTTLIDFKSQLYLHNIKSKRTETLFLGATKLLSDVDITNLFSFSNANFEDYPEEVKYRKFMISAIYLAKSRLICGLSNRSSPNDPILCVVDLKTRKIVYKYPPKDFEDPSWTGTSTRQFVIDQLIENDGWVYILYSNQLIAIEWEGERQEILLKYSYHCLSEMILRGNFLFISTTKRKFFIFDTNTRKLIHKDNFEVKEFAVSNSYCFLFHRVGGADDVYRVEIWDLLSPKKGDQDDLKSKKRKHVREDEKSDE